MTTQPATPRISRPSTQPENPHTALGGIEYYALHAAHMSDADRLAAIGELIRDYDEAVSAEAERRCDHHDSLYGRCADCGMTWGEQARQMGVVS